MQDLRVGLDLPVTKPDEPRAVFGDVHFVRDQQDGDPAFLVQGLKDVHDLDTRARVEVPGRLVGEQDRGLVGERARDGDALLLAPGELARVVARALVTQPAILLADEPTGNLDTRTSIEVMDIFQTLNRERGITILLITHEMDIAEYGTRFIRFRDGKIQTDSPVLNRRDAKNELAALPPPDEDPPNAPADDVPVEHIGGVV